MLGDERLSLLGELVLAISEAESADVALELVVGRLCEVTGWPVAQAWVVVEDGGRLRPSASWYGASDRVASLREASLELTFAPGVGLPGAAWASREPVWSSDVTTDPRFTCTGAAPGAGLEAGVAVPVLAGDEVVAVLEFYVYERREEDADLVALVAAAASQVGSLMRRKRAEDALRLSEERFRSVAETAADGIVCADASGTVTYANRRATATLGYEQGELIGAPLTRIIPDRYRDAHCAGFERFLTTGESRLIGQTVQLEAQRKDGSEFPVELSLATWQLAGERFFTGILRDVTERAEAEDRLRRSQLQLAEAQQLAHVGNWEFDPATGTACWSDELFRIHGLAPADSPPSPERLTELLHPDDRQHVLTQLEEAGRRRQPFELVHRIVRPDGAVRWVHARGRLREGGPGTRMIGTVQDVTERVAAEEELKSLHRLNALVLDAAADGIYGLDLDGRATFVNAAGARMVGRRVDELVGRQIHDLVHHSRPGHEPLGEHECRILGVLGSGAAVRADDEVFWRSDGTCFPVEYACTPILEDGRLTGAVVSFRDITERVAAQSELEARVRHRAAVVALSRRALAGGDLTELMQFAVDLVRETLEVHVAAISERLPDGTFVVRASSGSGGKAVGTVVARGGLADYTASSAGPVVSDRLATERRFSTSGLMAEGAVSSVTFPIAGGDEGVGVLAAHARTGRSFGEEEVNFLEVVANVLGSGIGRKRIEEDLRATSEWLEAVLDNSPASIYVKDLEGRYLLVNRHSAELLGMAKDDVVGRTDHDFLPAEVAAALRATDRRAIETRGPVEVEESFALGGEQRTFLGVKVPINDAGGEPCAICGIATEITDRKRASDELSRRTQLYEALLTAQSDLGVGVAIVDLQRERFVYANPSLCSIFGYSAAELYALDSYFDLVPKDGRELLEESQVRAHQNGLRLYETVVMHRSGRRIAVEAAAKPIDDGRRAVAVIRDISERARAERERQQLEQRFHQAQRLESVGQLAGGIAHDFNNLLAVILNYALFIREELGERDPLRQDLDEIRMAAERAASLTHQLLVLGRRDPAEPEVLDLASVVSGVERLLRGALGEDMTLVVNEADGELPIQADRRQLEQVLLNLAVNARDAMPRRGVLTVGVGRVRLDDAFTRARGLLPGDYARLTVADTGIGMSQDVAARAFEPFFTTKPRDQGTGLGLATAYGIVKAAGGHIELDSEPGTGTVVTAYFPLTERRAAPADSESGQERPSRPGATVMVVENEDAVRKLTERILSRNGYAVVSAAGPAEALEAWERSRASIDLILTDVVMPAMSGPELADAARSTRPGVPVLYMSGYPDEVLAGHGVPGDVSFIRKPFTAEDLLLAVAGALGDRDGRRSGESG